MIGGWGAALATPIHNIRGVQVIENIKAVNNPLTIIAIFAALAEFAGTVAIKLIGPELQSVFIWFVMLFPVLIVILFFITLNFNPKVLYAPSDFKNEDNFLSVIAGVKNLSIDLDEVQKQLESAKTEIIDDAVKQIAVAGENEKKHLSEIVNNRINQIQNKVETTIETAEVVAGGSFNQRNINKVLEALSGGQFLTTHEIMEKTGLSPRTITTVLNNARSSAVGIKMEIRGGKYRYSIDKKDAERISNIAKAI